MHVGVSGHGARGAAEMFDGGVEIALLFENAAEIVTGDAVQGIELDGILEASAGFLDVSGLIEGDAEIDVGFNPVGREKEYLAITIHSLRHHSRALFAVEGGFKDFFGSASGQLVRLGGGIGNAELESPLAADRIEGTRGTRRNDENFAAVVEDAEFLKGEGCDGVCGRR